MARAIWSGAISFGLVTVPVKLYSAVSKKTVRFHQLHGADGARIQQRRVCAEDGEEVPYEDIVKGYEISPGRYVVVENHELEALDPQRSHTIEIEDFVALADIDPIFYDHPYYLAPGPGGAKPYRLLVDAMRETGRVGIARVVLRSKEALVALRPMGEVLGMATMVFSDEVVPAESLTDLPGGDVETTDRELEIACQLVESLAADFKPESYRDTYRERVLDLIERKAAGEQVTVAPAPEAPKAAPDLMTALEASLAEVRGAKKPARRARQAPRRGSKAPAGSDPAR